MRRVLAHGSIAVVVAAHAACLLPLGEREPGDELGGGSGGSSGTGGFGAGPGPDLLEIDELPEAFVELYCGRQQECCVGDPDWEPPSLGTGDCEADMLGLARQWIDRMEVAIADGRLRYNDVSAAACIDSISNGSCLELFGADGDLSAACEIAFEPQVAQGGTCADGSECVSGYCEGADDGVEGTCRPEPGRGQPCPDYRCAEGLGCYTDTCVPTAGIGESCEQTYCGDDARCDFADWENPVCVARKGVGESCTEDSDCLNYTCSGGRCAEPCDGR